MKKLMIAACAVALSTAAQAAGFNWNWASSSAATTVFDTSGSTTALSDGTAYLIFGFTKAADINTSKTALYSALTAAGVTDYGSVIEGFANYTAQADLANGVVAEDPSRIFNTPTGGKQYGYIVVLDTDSKGNQWAYLSAAGYAEGIADDATGYGLVKSALNSTTVNEYGTGNTALPGWFQISQGAAPVPEPTSGLLLLLGVAGLALKRKRA